MLLAKCSVTKRVLKQVLLWGLNPTFEQKIDDSPNRPSQNRRTLFVLRILRGGMTAFLCAMSFVAVFSLAVVMSHFYTHFEQTGAFDLDFPSIFEGVALFFGMWLIWPEPLVKGPLKDLEETLAARDLFMSDPTLQKYWNNTLALTLAIDRSDVEIAKRFLQAKFLSQKISIPLS